MSKYWLIVFTFFMLTGCATNVSEQNSILKQELISKANAGDIKAMIELNSIFLFPETKEGYDYYDRWYDLVLNTDDPKAILSFSNVYEKYRSMYLKGEEKYYKLLEKAYRLGSEEAQYRLLGESHYKKKEVLEKQIVNQGDEKKLLKLLKFHDKNRNFKNSNELKKIMASKGYKTTYSKEDTELGVLYYESRSKYNKKIQSILASNDERKIFEAAKFVTEHKNVGVAIPLYERLVQLDSNNLEYYRSLAKGYLYYVNGISFYEDKVLPVLTKAALMDDYYATNELIGIYTKKPDLSDVLLDEYFNTDDTKVKEDKNKQAFAELKKDIADLNESKRALGDYYFKNGEFYAANDILNELAEKGNEKAIFTLVSRLQYGETSTGKSLGLKWSNYILESGNPALISKLNDEISAYDTDEAKKIHAKLDNYFIETQNIIYLQRLASINKSELSFKYLRHAAALGDVGSYQLLASKLFYSDSVDNVKEAIEIYSSLAEQNDISAIIRLAKFYESPRRPAEDLKDVNKAVSYYERAMELGDSSIFRSLACLYLCGNVVLPRELSYYENKMDTYVNELVPKQEGSIVIRDFASMYYMGYNVKKDYEKAAYYYVKSAEAGNIEGYKTAAEIYKEKLNDEEKYNLYINKID